MHYSVVELQEAKNTTDFRIDAECFQPVHLQTSELIGRIPNSTIGQMSKSVINFGAYSLCNFIEFLREGIPFITTEDIRNNIINTDNLHYVSKEVHGILYKSHCKPGQVLLTMAGAYLGQASVYYLDFESSSNQAIAKITLKENAVEPFYLSTFLNCRFGQSQIERFRTGTGQPNLNLGLIQTIKIPMLSASFQMYIREVVLNGIKLHLASRESYQQAEHIRDSELGLVNWKPKHRLSFIKKFSDTKSNDRIDAESFQPMYDELIGKVMQYRNGYKRLDDMVSIRKCVEPGSEAYQKDGIPFVRVSNLSKFGINNDNQQYISRELYEKLKSHQPQKGEILLSKDATPGIAYYLSNNPDKMIPSGGILRLRVKDIDSIHPEYLTLVLNSAVVQKQMERDIGGSVINHWHVDQVKKTIIPLLSNSAQKEISSLITESFVKLGQSEKLLEVAKRGVEVAIETGEQEAEGWLNREVESRCQTTM